MAIERMIMTAATPAPTLTPATSGIANHQPAAVPPATEAGIAANSPSYRVTEEGLCMLIHSVAS